MVSTALKRACLDDAYDQSRTAPTSPLRTVLRTNESTIRQAIAAGSIQSNKANGHEVVLAAYGPGQVTLLDMVECWRELIDLHDSAKAWLTWCFRYGLDPNDAEIDRVQDAPGDPVAQPTTVTDALVYEWLMGSAAVSTSTNDWPGKLIAVTEIRSDYTGMRVGSGMQWT